MILDQGVGGSRNGGLYQADFRTSGEPRTVYVVAGTGGDLEPRVGHHPAMFTDQLLIGSVVFDINTNRLDARFVLSTGDIADRFTIIKGEPAPFRFCTFFFRMEMWLLNGNPSATKPTRWSG